MLKAIWKGISKERNRNTLAWVGGAVVVLVSALWKVYTYEPPAKSAPVATGKLDQRTQPMESGQQARAETSGIAINAKDSASVVVEQPNR